MKKAFPYVRVSSDEQTKGNGIPEQITNAENYCPRVGLKIEKTLIDDGYSASNGDHLLKGKLGTFLAEAKKGKHKGDALVVSELDRLSRQGIRETRKLIDSFTENGVEIHITQTGRIIRDSEDLFTDILNSLESHGAAEYSRKLSERISKAWAGKKRNADSKVVTANVPFWLKVEDGKITPIPAEVKILREMFRLAALGLGAKKIALKINGGLAISTIQKTLANRATVGEYQPCRYVNGKRVPDGEPVTDYYPAVIKPSLWAAARAEIDRKNRMPNDSRRFCSKNDSADNLFTGLLYNATTRPARTLFFQAKNAKSYHSAMLVSAHDRDTHRKSNRLRYADFETAFLEFLKDLDWQSIANEGKSDEETQLEKQLNVKLSELDRVERRIAKTKAAMDADDWGPGELKILVRKLSQDEALLETLLNEKDALQASVEAAKAKTAALEDVDALKKALRNLSNVEMRLRARTEIRKRISSIRFTFTEDWGVVAYVSLVNGSGRVITILGDRAMVVRLDLNEYSGLLEWVESVKIIDL
jgi:DNA invertase Pin-like site-specific DNA recombinase